MTKVTESEFDAIKHYIETKKPKNPAIFFLRVSKLMDRSIATVHRIDASNNFKAYKKLIQSEHTAKNPRVPLQEQLLEARISELLLVKSRGRMGAYKQACNRLDELFGQ